MTSLLTGKGHDVSFSGSILWLGETILSRRSETSAVLRN